MTLKKHPLPASAQIDYDTQASGGSMPKGKPYVRLTQPLVRDGGVFRPAGWEEALDFTARGLKSVVEKHGGQSFGLFSCSKATNEMNFVAQKFARVVMGSNNIDSCNRT
jgi:predicted molibdopterin-dependent oxidoreductase YjgC